MQSVIIYLFVWKPNEYVSLPLEHNSMKIENMSVLLLVIWSITNT